MNDNELEAYPSVIRIGLSGKMLSGKSSVAQYLINKYDFVEYSFAKKLKQIIKERYNYNGKDRAKLQDFGEKVREFDRSFWTGYVIKEIPLDRNVVISDVRYDDEADLLKDIGFTLIRLVVNRKMQLERLKKRAEKLDLIRLEHNSETALDKYGEFDYVIDANGSLDELCEQIDAIIESIRLEKLNDAE